MNKEVLYLNPWEFMTHWDVLLLPRPVKERSSSDLPEDGTEDTAQQRARAPCLSCWKMDESGQPDRTQWQVNPEAVLFYASRGTLLFYPEGAGGSVELRNTFFMQRRTRPIVPAPSSCPMPEKERTSEGKARLYSIYLRPWVCQTVMLCWV